ncbi:MAG: hypothetical protein RIC55_24080 [Pirellulaceae bacterium]
MKTRLPVWTLTLIAAAALIWGVLGLYRTTGAAPKDVQMPFANPVAQRQDMIRELQEIKSLLKEQNSLLRTWLAKSGR